MFLTVNTFQYSDKGSIIRYAEGAALGSVSNELNQRAKLDAGRTNDYWDKG